MCIRDRAKGAKLEEALDVFLEKVVGKRQDGVPESALAKAARGVAKEVEALAETCKDERSAEHSHGAGTLPHGHTQPAIHTPGGKFTKRGRLGAGGYTGGGPQPDKPSLPRSYPMTEPRKAEKFAKQAGWTEESRKKFWEKISRAVGAQEAASLLALATLSLGEPGGHTACVERMEGKVDDPHAFCSYAEHEATGYWPREKRD